MLTLGAGARVPAAVMPMLQRLFIAIDLPPPVRWQLATLVAEPQRGVRPVPPAQLHLTLHFLGAVADEDRMALQPALAAVQQEPFTITVRGTGVFPPHGRPTVLWAGVAESAALVALHAAIATAIAACGLAVERRPYVPHVTLARLTPGAPRAWTSRFLAATADLAIDAIAVDRFLLYESRRLDGATEHLVAATFPLQPPAAACRAAAGLR